MAGESSHSIVRQAATVASVVETQIGADMQLPVRANNWKINDLTAQYSRVTATAAQSGGGVIRIVSPSGDVIPDPAPAYRPVYASGSFLGGTEGVSTCPLHRFPIELEAAGKATIQAYATNSIAVTGAPIYGIGLHFAPEIVVPQRPLYGAFVRATQTAIARAQIGTITLSEKATEIVEIRGVISQNGVLVTAEELVGFFDMESDDLELQPSQWLFNEVFGAGLSTVIQGGQHFPPMPHQVSIPVVGGASIDVFCTLVTAVTNAADVLIYIGYR